MTVSTMQLLGLVAVAICFYFLHLLLKMVEWKVEKQKREPKVTWDWIFVFAVKDEDFEGANDVQKCVGRGVVPASSSI